MRDRLFNFQYLIDKIENSEFQTVPFKHVYIENFFHESDFLEIIQSPEIVFSSYQSDYDLIEALLNTGYEQVVFPGTTNVKTYLDARLNGKRLKTKESSCESVGVVFRLKQLNTPILKSLNEFICGKQFNQTIARKFDVKYKECRFEGGVQKYLDGYEISPHPDVRSKATTFMVNINPSTQSEKMDYHTHYSMLKNEYGYVKDFWENNPNIQRCWIPWDWTTTIKQQIKNNSIVCFSPDDQTIHGVKANYNHLITQRTQLYGNLWYQNPMLTKSSKWEHLDIKQRIDEKINLKKTSQIKLNLNQIANILSLIKKENPQIAENLKKLL